MTEYMKKARELGFANVGLMKVKDLVIIPEYRKYCEDNLCGCYNKMKACPPMSGTVKEMTEKIQQYEGLMVLQTVVDLDEEESIESFKEQKRHHNILSEKLLEYMAEKMGRELLLMGAGPWKTHSCMSAYCIDAQKMAESVGMKCWEQDSKIRYFSSILF